MVGKGVGMLFSNQNKAMDDRNGKGRMSGRRDATMAFCLNKYGGKGWNCINQVDNVEEKDTEK